MKKKILSFFLALVALYSCFSEPFSLSLDDFVVLLMSPTREISLLDPPDLIEERLGKPITTIVNSEYDYQTQEYGSLKIGLFVGSSEINNLQIMGPHAQTSRGLRIGMSRDDVVRLYGPADKSEEKYLNYFYIHQAEPNRVPKDFVIIFSFDEENKVNSIVLYTDW